MLQFRIFGTHIKNPWNNKMDVSFIISSYNQKKRLEFCLQSATNQEGDFEYEVILADDNSTDGTKEMVESNFPNVEISYNTKSKKETYTLANNWNTAAKKAKGKRLVFSNADMIFSKFFLGAHLDPIMQDSIIFGPGFNTPPEVEPLLDSCKTVTELIERIDGGNMIGKEKGHSEGSAETYNKEWSWHFPFGYNFSVIGEQFFGVDGFPGFEKWGHEDIFLCKKIVEKYGTKVKSNSNAYSLHLWHPVVNDKTTSSRIDNISF